MSTRALSSLQKLKSMQLLHAVFYQDKCAQLRSVMWIAHWEACRLTHERGTSGESNKCLLSERPNAEGFVLHWRSANICSLSLTNTHSVPLPSPENFLAQPSYSLTSWWVNRVRNAAYLSTSRSVGLSASLEQAQFFKIVDVRLPISLS
jgi:hypothetical protein